MELKAFQKDVISDLERYLDLVAERKDYQGAFQEFWMDKEAPDLGWYQDTVPGAPAVCFKIPTGGGKTLTAAASVKPVFDALPTPRYRAVIWLVPSLAILEQTERALKDPRHPYRQRLDADFQGRVEVYTKEELLGGQNFSPAAISEQLSVMVLSYDSFKPRSRRDKEALKARQANEALQTFAGIGESVRPARNAEPLSLIDVLNRLNPVVLIDESHHAKTPLSLEMIQDFNPAMVLEFTATPRPESNILSYVDALQLKRENMVKLPMIVYNRREENDVLIDSIALRDTLEALAGENERRGGQHIRPIALFQAQPRTAGNEYTHERICAELEKAGVPQEQIAVRTADINELKGVDLMSPQCPIRYIVTVNALTEGWDCPFAYVLASTANRNSPISVEQILGRILRQPYTMGQQAVPLNMSYVLTCSSDFDGVVRQLIKDLHYIGFSRREFRAIDAPPAEDALPAAGSGAQEEEAEPSADDASREEGTAPPAHSAPQGGEQQAGASQISFAPWMGDPLRGAEPSPAEGGKDREPPSLLEERGQSMPPAGTSGFDGDAARKALDDRRHGEAENPADSMIDQAQKEQEEFSKEIARNEKDHPGVSTTQARHMSRFKMRSAFAPEASALRLPQFFVKEEPVQGSWFSADIIKRLPPSRLDPVNLSKGFSLAKEPVAIQFEATDSDVYKIDTDAGGSGVPTAFMQSDRNREQWLRLFRERSPERQRKDCVRELMRAIGPFNMVSQKELRAYVSRAVDTMSPDALAAAYVSPATSASRIRTSIDELLKRHYRIRFGELARQNKLLCLPSYELPAEIHPASHADIYGNSLYEAEDARMNALELAFARQLSSEESVLWWHRNPERKPDSFRINGFINHYPDFIIRTRSGLVLVAETKGLHLNLEDSMERLELGKTWERLAGPSYRYYMVFEDRNELPGDAVGMSEFLQILRNS